MLTLTIENQSLSLLVNRGLCSHRVYRRNIESFTASQSKPVFTPSLLLRVNGGFRSHGASLFESIEDCVHTEPITVSQQRPVFTRSLSLRVNRGLCSHGAYLFRVNRGLCSHRAYHCESIEASVHTEPISSSQQRPVFTRSLSLWVNRGLRSHWAYLLESIEACVHTEPIDETSDLSQWRPVFTLSITADQ